MEKAIDQKFRIKHYIRRFAFCSFGGEVFEVYA